MLSVYLALSNDSADIRTLIKLTCLGDIVFHSVTLIFFHCDSIVSTTISDMQTTHSFLNCRVQFPFLEIEALRRSLHYLFEMKSIPTQSRTNQVVPMIREPDQLQTVSRRLSSDDSGPPRSYGALGKAFRVQINLKELLLGLAA